MDDKAFESWLAEQLRAHPLRELPTLPHDAAYTAQVMARIEAQRDPQPAWWRLLGQRAVLAGVFACVLALVVTVWQRPAQLARRAERDGRMLAAIGELDDAVEPRLEDDVETVDRLMLANSAIGPASDKAWIQGTMQLLNALDEDDDDNRLEPSDEGLLRQLDDLDASGAGA